MSFRSKIRNFINRYSAQSLVERLEKLIKNVQKSIENTGNSFFEIILIFFLVCLIGLKEVGLFIKNISDKIAALLKIIWDFFENIWENIVKLIEWIINGIINFFRAIRDFIINIWKGIIRFFENIWENIIKLIEWIINGIVNFFRTLWKNIVKLIKLIFEDFIEFINLIWQFFRKIFILPLVEEIGFYFKRLKDYSKTLKENLNEIVQKLQEYSEYLSHKFENKNAVYNPSIKKSYWNLSGNSIFWLIVLAIWGILAIGMTIVLLLGSIVAIPFLHQYIRKDLIGNNE